MPRPVALRRVVPQSCAEATSRTAPEASSLEDPLTAPATRAETQHAGRALATAERSRKQFRWNLIERRGRWDQHAFNSATDSEPARVAEANQRIRDAMQLVDDHRKVDAGRARRLRMLTSALTDEPHITVNTPLWNDAIARLEAPDLKEHPEALGARAGLALSALDDAKVPWRASLTDELHAQRVNKVLDVADSDAAILPTELNRLIVGMATDRGGLLQEAAGRHAKSYYARQVPDAAFEREVWGGAAAGATATSSVALPVFLPMGPIGILIGAGLSAAGFVGGAAAAAIGGMLKPEGPVRRRLKARAARKEQDRAFDRNGRRKH